MQQKMTNFGEICFRESNNLCCFHGCGGKRPGAAARGAMSRSKGAKGAVIWRPRALLVLTFLGMVQSILADARMPVGSVDLTCRGTQGGGGGALGGTLGLGRQGSTKALVARAARWKVKPPVKKQQEKKKKQPAAAAADESGITSRSFKLARGSKEMWWEAGAKYLAQRMQWDFDSAAPDFPLFPFFRFQHQLPVPLPWPTESANITLGTVFKPAIPQSWVSASVPFYKGVTLVASAATDSARPMSEPFLSGGAEYSLKLPVVDGPLNHVAAVLQQPLARQWVNAFESEFLAYAGLKNYGGNGAEASAGLTTCVSIGNSRIRGRVTVDKKGRARYTVSFA